jgi:hypothetical protein
MLCPLNLIFAAVNHRSAAAAAQPSDKNSNNVFIGKGPELRKEAAVTETLSGFPLSVLPS